MSPRRPRRGTANGLPQPVASAILRPMARSFPCPYLGGDVELTDEREAHIAQKHERVFAEGDALIARVLATPDVIRRDARTPETLLFTRWYDDLAGSKHAVVVW